MANSDQPGNTRKITDVAKSDEPDDAREPHGELWVDRWIYPALRDASLLAIVLVVAGHLVAFVAPILIFAARDRRLGAQMAVFGLLFLTYACARFEFRRYGRPGLLSGWIAGTWLAALAAAWACNRYALF